MSALTEYLENKLIDHILRGTSFSQPDVYVGLVGKFDAAQLEAGTLTHELTGGSYARIGSIRGDAYWSAGGTSGLTDNESAITFRRVILILPLLNFIGSMGNGFST